MGSAIYMIFIWLLCALGLAIADISKHGSAYDGLIVAMHDSVPEDLQYLETLKELIETFSESLYKSTDGAAYFRRVTIAVPQTWNRTENVSNVLENYYPSSHIRIVSPQPDSSQITAPFTLQPGGCGEAGQYIQFNTDFLMHESISLVQLYGTKERLLVHEWAHFRFGVFDEYGVPGHNHFPLFYFNDGFLEVSVCPMNVKGWMYSESYGDTCDVFENRVSSDCFFIPDETDYGFDFSLMSIPKLPQVDHFCENTDSNRSHNWRAPTQQNLMCQGRSSWEIISSHPDIAKMGSKTLYHPPEFEVIRFEKADSRYVLVLDLSTSMHGRPLEIMKQACSLFIMQQIPTGSYLGIVGFSTTAWVVSPLGRVNNETRAAFSQAVQRLQVVSATSIGAGLQRSLQVLRMAKQPTEGAKILLLTDGYENQHPLISAVISDVVNAKVQVDSIALGSTASLELEKLALNTNGKTYLFPDLHGDSSGQLSQIFLETITVHGDVQVDFLELHNNQYRLADTNTRFIPVIVDKELGKNSVFTVSSAGIDKVVFGLVSPSGIVYNMNSSEYSEDVISTKTAVYKFAEAESGLWNMTLHKTTLGLLTVDVSLVSEPRTVNEKPVRVKSWINATIIQYPDVPKVFAQVTKGNDVIIRARVQAIITSDLNRVVKILLKDDGNGADVFADDGIYSGYFSDFRYQEKRYAVVAEVTSAGEALIKRDTKISVFYYSIAGRSSDTEELRKEKPSSTFSLDRFRIVDEDPDRDKSVGERIDDFDRVTNAGSFRIEGLVSSSKDRIKPSSIKDLKVSGTGLTGERKTVSLQWTAPGNDMDLGTASALELRGGNNSLSQDSFFTSGYLFINDNSTVLSGSLNTAEAGTAQNVTVLLPIELETESKSFDVLFSIRARDEAGNVGDMGNVVSAHFGYSIVDRTESSTQTAKEDDKKDSNTNMIVGLSVGAVVLVIVVIVVVIIIHKKRRSKNYV